MTLMWKSRLIAYRRRLLYLHGMAGIQQTAPIRFKRATVQSVYSLCGNLDLSYRRRLLYHHAIKVQNEQFHMHLNSNLFLLLMFHVLLSLRFSMFLSVFSQRLICYVW